MYCKCFHKHSVEKSYFIKILGRILFDDAKWHHCQELVIKISFMLSKSRDIFGSFTSCFGYQKVASRLVDSK